MRLLQGFMVATFLALIWLGWFAMWGMIHYSKKSLDLHSSLEPAWFQSFNVWASAFAYLLMACSLTACTNRIIRIVNGKADAAEQKATLYRVWKRGKFLRIGESLIMTIAGTFGVIAFLAIMLYAIHLRTGESSDHLIDLIKPIAKPLIAVSVLAFAGVSAWMYWREFMLLKAWRQSAQA